MDQETVVKEQLTPWAISAGQDLTRKLRQTDFDLVASFWLYSSDTNGWRLILASPRVESEGPLRAYERIREILASSPETEKWADYSVSVTRPNTPPVRAIRSFGRFEIPDLLPGPTVRILDPKRIRFANVDGVFIEDAYIYFIR